MQERRSFSAHVELFAKYAGRVAELPPAAWDRLLARCADLDSQSFAALFARARLAAKPYELWLPTRSDGVGALKILAGASRVVQTGLATAFELISEFDTSGSPSRRTPASMSQTSGNQTTDAFIAANALIESALSPFERAHPGVGTAVRAAGQAVLRHDYLSSRHFIAAYALVEPEIPFHTLIDREKNA